MTMIEESIDEILRSPQRKLVVADTNIDLRNKTKNQIFILSVEESRGSAGGRGGGSGNRRINKIIGFKCADGVCRKYFETEDHDLIQQFEIPYSAVAMDIKLSIDRVVVVQGVVDEELVKSYLEILSNLK